MVIAYSNSHVAGCNGQHIRTNNSAIMLPNTYVITAVICMHRNYKLVHRIVSYNNIRSIIIMFTYVAIKFDISGYLKKTYVLV